MEAESKKGSFPQTWGGTCPSVFLLDGAVCLNNINSASLFGCLYSHSFVFSCDFSMKLLVFNTMGHAEIQP